MSKLTRLIFVLAISVGFLTSCKKDDPGVNPMDRVFNIYFSRNALEYVNIPVGKYFVYKVTGFTAPDSVVVVSNQLDTVNLPRDVNSGFPEHNIERFRIRMNKYFPLAGGGVVITEWLRGTAFPDFFLPYDSTSIGDVLLSSPATGLAIFYGTHNPTGLQNLVVEGVTYNGVIMTESNNGLPVSDPAYEKNVYYWARGLGIVKRIKTTWNGVETTWSLLRHN